MTLAIRLPRGLRCLGVAAALCLAPLGCSSVPQLMPTPNIYAKGERDPFPDVPLVLQNNRVDVLYFTDRGADPQTGKYGFVRSRSVGFGSTEVRFGKDVSWDELKEASRTAKRSVELPMTIVGSKELVRFPPTPRTLVKPPEAQPPTQAGPTMLGDQDDPEEVAAENLVKSELAARLAQTPVKEVYLFVHGYNNNFDDAVTTIAQLWHFFGRQGVPVAYSWPAGRGGLLRGYTYDRESSEFTVYHLKQTLRLLAECPEVKKVHVIAHSRGTDVAFNAIRELHLEIHGSGRNTREVLKLATVVLAAPDIDLDVVIQKFTTVRLGQVPEQFAIYVCANDKALGLATWLFGSFERMGQLRADIFTPEERKALRESKTVQIIDARISDAGAFGHDYFHSSPAVSSDLILLVRYGLKSGDEHGRPLGVDESGFWIINDAYPAGENPAPAKEPAK